MHGKKALARKNPDLRLHIREMYGNQWLESSFSFYSFTQPGSIIFITVGIWNRMKKHILFKHTMAGYVLLFLLSDDQDFFNQACQKYLKHDFGYDMIFK